MSLDFSKKPTRFTEYVGVCLSPGQRLWVESTAKAHGVSISHILRVLVDEASGQSERNGEQLGGVL